MLDRRCGGNPGWNVFTGAQFLGPLDVQALHRGLLEIVKRHEAARTSLRQIGGRLMQVIQPELEFPLPILDLRGFPADQRSGESQAAIGSLYREQFDLSEAPLIRPTLLRLGDEDHQLLVIMHHTITDWVSFAILNREMAMLYQRYSRGQNDPLPKPTLQYRDYAFWERDWEDTSESGQAQLDYWKKKLAGAAENTPLPLDHDRPAVQTFAGARHPVTLGAEGSAALIAGSRKEGVTPFVTILAGFAVLLRSLSGCEDVVIGSPVVGRPTAETENALGLFLNHLALRMDVSGSPRFRELLGQVNETVMSAYANQQMPFGRIVRELRPNPNPKFTPLFQVMFFYLAMPPIQPLPGLDWRNIEAYGGTSRYDLLLSVWEKPEGISGFLEYNTDLFAHQTAAGMSAALERILTAAAGDFDLRVGQLAAIAVREFDSAQNAARI